MRQFLFFLEILLLFECNYTNRIASDLKVHNLNQIEKNFIRTDGQFLILKNGSHISTRLYEMKYVESLLDRNGNTYFVVSGKTCSNCDENISIFIINLQDTITPIDDLPKYSYPGKELNYENHKLVFDSELFIGRGINKGDSTISLVWVQKEMNSKENLDSSMFIVDIFNGKIRERIIKPQSLEFKQNLLILKKFKKIKGIETTSEP